MYCKDNTYIIAFSLYHSMSLKRQTSFSDGACEASEEEGFLISCEMSLLCVFWIQEERHTTESTIKMTLRQRAGHAMSIRYITL